MWGMFGLSPDWMSQQNEEADEKVPWDPDDTIHVGDIITVATHSKRPVLQNSVNFDDMAQLRVLSEEMQGERKLYLCLVTAGDAEHITPTVVVGRRRDTSIKFAVDEYFNDCDAIIISEFQVRSIAKKQRGRFCEKCTEYNEDVRTPLSEPYLCTCCRENPWR